MALIGILAEIALGVCLGLILLFFMSPPIREALLEHLIDDIAEAYKAIRALWGDYD